MKPPRDIPSTTPLPKKLGIKPDTHLAIIAAPDGFLELIESPPHTTNITSTTNLALCFIRTLRDLAATLDLITARLPPKASAWIIRPKRTGRFSVDFNENHVRDAALDRKLVDYKICSVDDDWSAIKFTWRRS
jgi:hypothetical protein